MRQFPALPPLRTRFTNWLSEELHPKTLGQIVAAGVLTYILEMILVLSFGALIFSGSLADQLPYGLGFIIVSDAVICGVVALLSSFPGSIGVEQDTPSAILAAGAAGILAALPAATPTVQFATVVMMLVGTSLVMGLFFLLLGVFKLGGLVRFLPMPVMGGFLAGTGWLLFRGGIGVMTTGFLSLNLFESGLLIRWLPGVVLGAVIVFMTRRFRNPLVLPGLFALGIALFYGVSWLVQIPVGRLIAEGWLLGAFPSGSLWHFPLTSATLSQVNWMVLAGQIPTVAPVLIISVIALLLNANGLELIVKRDINLNRELITAGIANLAAGFTGGMIGYHAISLSTLNYAISRGKRLPGLLTALLVAMTALVGVSALMYIPRMVLGALLAYLGLSLLVEWVYEAWFKFSKIDFLIIVVILLVVTVRGFLEGIGVGLILTIIMFVVNYSQISVVKHAMSGADYRSRVTRSLTQQSILETDAGQIFILKLQGFIFFGTANSLYEQVRERAHNAALGRVRFVLLDFAQVSGLDSTGLLSFSKMLLLAQDRHITLVLTGLSGQAAEQFQKGHLEDASANVRLFPDLDRGIEWCENEIITTHETAAETDMSLEEQLQAIVPSAHHLRRLIQAMTRREIAHGEYLFHQNDEPDLLFFIESGQLTAQLETPSQPPMRLETMRRGRSVGEIGFYLGTQRSAAVIADEPSVIYSLSKADIDRLEQTDSEAASALHQIIAHLLSERVVHLIRAVNALQQ